ncbi:hypothetical protein EKO27_g5479 [Xylaria grammica]|uniref:Alpha/beta hydrolase fold-3 domain-containing protein n=1 Tax=Xylaria grammica TaxID=363999 RepID=A0A439D5F0_9PEZI|nr:hypothetical protein EKO27_g5479 [Xylaria grammica]
MPTPCPFNPELGRLLAAAPPELTATLTLETLSGLSSVHSEPSQTYAEFIGGRDIRVTDYTILGYQGAGIRITIFCRSNRELTAKAPAFYFIHGGGMVMGHRLLGADFLLPYVEEFDGVFASVEYRVAPKYPYPVPVEDSYAGLVWLSTQGEKLGFDPEKIMIVGASAGAGIAAGVTLLARDRDGPRIAWQLLASPMLDDRDTTLSSRQYENHGVWDANSNRTGWSAYLGDRLGGPDVPIYAAPARAVDSELGLVNLPHTYLDVGSADVFRDEIVAYASGIWAVGGKADLHVWAGGFHAFDMWVTPRLTREALAARHNWVRRMVGQDPVFQAFEAE